jgi:hypothetical protein
VKPSRRKVLVLLALAVALGACAADRGVERPPGSAVLGSVAELAALAPGEVEHLRRAGVREVFVEAGALRWEGEVARVEGRLAGSGDVAAPRLPAVVSVHGAWSPRAGAAPEAVGAALADALLALSRRGVAAGLAVTGVHLDLEVTPGEAVDGYGRALSVVREELSEDLLLAVSLDRALLRSPEADVLAEPADVLVAFLFGPRAAGRPGPRGEEAWSLDGVEDDLARLAELGTPYLVGIGTVGGVARAGGAQERWTGVRLGALLADRALDPRPAPLFAASDAQLYPFVARRPTRLGDWDLAAGEEIEARRLAPHHLRALVERIEAAGSPLHLGQLYDRLPRPGEGLALTPAELAAAADPAAAAPRLELVLERAGGGLRVGLAHRVGAATEVAAFDHNYVEVRLAGGSFGAVDPGGFARYELLADGRRAADQAALRRADTLRLYTPFLEAGDEVASGAVRHSGTATATARFLMPDGTVVEAAAEE